MREGRQTALPDGDYLMLADEREGRHVLGDRVIRLPGMEFEIADQHDRDAEQSRAIATARFDCFRDLRSERTDFRVFRNNLWEHPQFRFTSNLLSPVSYFYGSPPPCEVHYDIIGDFATEPEIRPDGGLFYYPYSYRLVSRAWKEAIETLEPNTHEFFSHIVAFEGYDLENHFIFRCGGAGDYVDPEHSVQPGAVERIVPEGHAPYYYINSRPKGLAVKRQALAGRHWTRDDRVEWPIVSRELASALLPLLPDCLEAPNAVSFIPLVLV